MKSLQTCLSSFDKHTNPYNKTCQEVFNQVSLDTQKNKLVQSGIFDLAKQEEIIAGLKVRPALLSYVANFFRDQDNKMEAFVEVGTAQGMQSLCFANSFPDSNVYTCDIVDHRAEQVKNNERIKFFMSDSLTMTSKLNNDVKFDFCWVDGAHQAYDVVHDFLSLSRHTHENTVWAFDDFDERFGCYNDILVISRQFKECVMIDLGLTGSGNPNKIILARKTK